MLTDLGYQLIHSSILYLPGIPLRPSYSSSDSHNQRNAYDQEQKGKYPAYKKVCQNDDSQEQYPEFESHEIYFLLSIKVFALTIIYVG